MSQTLQHLEDSIIQLDHVALDKEHMDEKGHTEHQGMIYEKIRVGFGGNVF